MTFTLSPTSYATKNIVYRWQKIKIRTHSYEFACSICTTVSIPFTKGTHDNNVDPGRGYIDVIVYTQVLPPWCLS